MGKDKEPVKRMFVAKQFLTSFNRHFSLFLHPQPYQYVVVVILVT